MSGGSPDEFTQSGNWHNLKKDAAALPFTILSMRFFPASGSEGEKTSHVSPLRIREASSCEPPDVKLIVIFGFLTSKASFIRPWSQLAKQHEKL